MNDKDTDSKAQNDETPSAPATDKPESPSSTAEASEPTEREPVTGGAAAESTDSAAS